MDDRIAEIREALANYWPFDFPDVEFTDPKMDHLGVVLSAARAYADLLDSDALIIRRDEDGKWPRWAVVASAAHHRRPKHRSAMDALVDALASSQGVEPTTSQYQSNSDLVVEGVEPQ